MKCERVLALLLVTGTLWSPAAAQDRARVWLGVGAGGAGGHDAAGAALMAELVLQKRAHYIAIRGLLAFDPYDSDVIGELGALYGRAAKRPWGHAAIAGGSLLPASSPAPSSRPADARP